MSLNRSLTEIKKKKSNIMLVTEHDGGHQRDNQQQFMVKSFTQVYSCISPSQNTITIKKILISVTLIRVASNEWKTKIQFLLDYI